jgi:hypothetical protein
MNTNETNDPNPWRPLEPGEKPQMGDLRRVLLGGRAPVEPCDCIHDPGEYMRKNYFTRRPRPAPTSSAHCRGFESMPPETQQSIAKMCQLAADDLLSGKLDGGNQTAREWVKERAHEGGSEPFYSWVYESAALELATRCEQAEAAWNAERRAHIIMCERFSNLQDDYATCLEELNKSRALAMERMAERASTQACQCGSASTGWTEIKCCNLCGGVHRDETLPWSVGPATPEPEWRPLEPGEKPQPGDIFDSIGGWNSVWQTRRPRPAPTTCTHPDHTVGSDCLDRSVGCSPHCVCCMGELNAAHQRTADELNAQQRLHTMETARLTQERDDALARVAELEAELKEAKEQASEDKAKWQMYATENQGLLTKSRRLEARVRELQAELAKLYDPVAVHINMLRGTIATPSRELMEHVWHGDPPSPQYLDRPNKPGWWWSWWEGEKKWVCEHVINPHWYDPCRIWLPATPPPPPSKEEQI